MASSRSSDRSTSENTWLWITIIAIVSAVVALATGNFILKHERQAQREYRDQAEAFETYRENTRTSAPPPQVSAKVEEERRIRETLLHHPAVTPGPGFAAPGVQTTGIAIVEAIDRARQ